MLRRCATWFAAGLLSCLAAGCAQRTTQSAATAPPHPEELAELPLVEHNIAPVSVAVEDLSDAPRLKLVGDYTPPELTPEERRAMGITEPVIDFLEFYRPEDPSRPVSEFTESARYGIGPAAGLSGQGYSASRPFGVHRKSPIPTGVYPVAAGTSVAGPPVDAPYAQGRRSRVQVGEGPARGLAAPARRVER